MNQAALFEEPLPTDEEADESTDSYCTPPEVMEPIRRVAKGRIALDPWTNHYAISHGWVRAKVSWTLQDGRSPGDVIDRNGPRPRLDITSDPRPWPLKAGDFVWGNPKYSDPLPEVLRFMLECERAKAWGTLLLKQDSRTKWCQALLDQNPRPPIALWRGPINFFHKGERVRGNNFASTLYVVDHTGTPAGRRAKQLERAFGERAWVYR